ncbi:universal stress protein [Babesia caballi]|uniref:Universal stress protein n=1 Tax=Babesia caballi TaxID=5871 RepID=A0AAV4LR46_BABCB|nr:universal stress protein [Babesia caballi]
MNTINVNTAVPTKFPASAQNDAPRWQCPPRHAPSNQKALNVVLRLDDLLVQGRALATDDGARDHRPRYSAGAPERNLALYENVGDVLVLADKGKVEDDLEGLGIGRQNDDLGESAVERLGSCTESVPTNERNPPSLAPFLSCL